MLFVGFRYEDGVEEVVQYSIEKGENGKMNCWILGTVPIFVPWMVGRFKGKGEEAMEANPFLAAHSLESCVMACALKLANEKAGRFAQSRQKQVPLSSMCSV